MAKTKHVHGNRRSVVPLSLALLVFNALGGGESARSATPEPGDGSRTPPTDRPEDPTDPASAPRRVC